MQNIFLMFRLGHGRTPRDELYGIVDQPIDHDLSLHELINILELSTLDRKVWTIPIIYGIDCFFVMGRYKFL